MVTNLLFTKIVNITIGESGIFILPNGDTVSVDEVPVIRYRLGMYGEKEIKFISETLQKFPRSLHVADVDYATDLQITVNSLGAIYSLKHVAKFVRVPFSNADATAGRLLSVNTEALSQYSEYIDRYILVDQSTNLHVMSASRLKSYAAKAFNVAENKVAFCCSPVIWDSNSVCLPAIVARELGAEYGIAEDMVIATNAMEGRNLTDEVSCRCMKHTEIIGDITPAAERSVKDKKEKAAPKEAKVKEKKEKPAKEAVGGFMNTPDDSDTDSKATLKVPVKKKAKRGKGVLLPY